MQRPSPFAVLAAWIFSPIAASPQSAPAARVTLDEIGVFGSYGLRTRDRVQWAALTGALDAAFVGDRVAVLAPVAPWVRIYDATDSLVATAVPGGTGPGRAQRAYSLASSNGHLLVAHRSGLMRVNGDGELVGSLPGDWPVSQVTGAVEACGGDPVIRVERLPAFEDVAPGSPFGPTTALVRLRLAEEVLDTLATFPSTHLESWIYHPWLADVRDDRLLLYSEESSVDRMMEITCDGEVVAQTPLDSIHHPRGDRTERGYSVTVPRPPFASGLLRVEGAVLWATREVMDGGDSVTVVTSFENGAASRRLEIDGWFKLFDVGPDGSILVGNTWALGLNWDYPVTWRGAPAVFRIDGTNLLRLVRERGTSPGP